MLLYINSQAELTGFHFLKIKKTGKLKQMKKLIILGIALVSVLISTAQMPPDDDNDGISNSEDLCPKTKGTKANKGCPENATEKAGSTSFLTNKEFETIMDAVCLRTQSQLINTSIPVAADGMQQTTLPFTGPKKQFPIYYNENKNEIITTTIIILSDNENDLEPAYIELLTKIKTIQTLCLVGKKIETGSDASTGEKSILFRNMLGNGEFEMRIYKHNNGGQSLIIWNIFTVDPEKEKKATAATAKSQGVFDKNFADDMKKILSASSNGFVKNRIDGKKNTDGEMEFRTNLPTLKKKKKAVLTTSDSYSPYDDSFKILEYSATSDYKTTGTNIEAIVTELERKCDGSLDFEKKEIVKEANSVVYTIKGKPDQKVTLMLIVTQSEYLIYLTVTDKSVEFKNQ